MRTKKQEANYKRSAAETDLWYAKVFADRLSIQEAKQAASRDAAEKLKFEAGIDAAYEKYLTPITAKD